MIKLPPICISGNLSTRVFCLYIFYWRDCPTMSPGTFGEMQEYEGVGGAVSLWSEFMLPVLYSGERTFCTFSDSNDLGAANVSCYFTFVIVIVK